MSINRLTMGVGAALFFVTAHSTRVVDLLANPADTDEGQTQDLYYVSHPDSLGRHNRPQGRYCLRDSKDPV